MRCATGLVLGGVYGVAAVLDPRVTVGAGLPYGAAVAVVLDEGIVPAVGPSGPPWTSPASTHAYALASHLVFGLTVEVVRRGALDPLRTDERSSPKGRRRRA